MWLDAVCLHFAAFPMFTISRRSQDLIAITLNYTILLGSNADIKPIFVPIIKIICLGVFLFFSSCWKNEPLATVSWNTLYDWDHSIDLWYKRGRDLIHPNLCFYSMKKNSVVRHDDVIKWKHLCVTGHLCGEFTGPRWIPHTKASDAELGCDLSVYYLRSFWVRLCLLWVCVVIRANVELKNGFKSAHRVDKKFLSTC